MADLNNVFYMISLNSSFGIDFPKAIFRSLLQKSVRRGYVELTEKVALALAEHGDSKWLKTRANIILFEECWPLARTTNPGTPTIEVLKEVARHRKNKDASGLGSLAYEYFSGNRRAATDSPDSLAVRVVAAGLERPDAFFNWVESKHLSSEQKAVVVSARLLLKRASWQWDKAFCIAASYLAMSPISKVDSSTSNFNCNFPIWVAIDKHTPQGRAAIQRAGAKLKIPYNQLSWISFYFESAKVNYLVDSPWWNAERKWRFEQLKISESYATGVWQEASIIIEEDLNFQTLKIYDLIKKIG
ncbi:hypothetical protein [Pseudomonas taetrolens]|nr:hypothetical protein [Pseudomonas taetrolens]